MESRPGREHASSRVGGGNGKSCLADFGSVSLRHYPDFASVSECHILTHSGFTATREAQCRVLRFAFGSDLGLGIEQYSGAGLVIAGKLA
jgi:hypothetical protein